MAVRGKEAAAVLPKPGPNLFAVRLRQFQSVQCRARKEFKSAFGVNRRKGFQLWFHFEQEHEPVGVALVTVFADEAGEMQIARCEMEAGFFQRFTTGAGVGGFAFVGMQFPAARTPEAAIGLLSALEQKDFVLLVEAVEQGGDFVGQLHARQ